MPVDPPDPRDERVLAARLSPGRLEAVDVAAAVVLEAERILGAESRVPLLERARVE
jgi:hypothetical protein